ncbi:hypothetical protein EXIGLDRAFT_596186, partial [Exidia glandulosa HHB12029]
EELGALVGFLSVLASNSLPLTTNPHSYLDPDLVLEFDTRSGDEENIVKKVEQAVADAWTNNPVVIFSELSSTAAPASREMKGMMEALALSPAPTVFEVDKRVDASVLRPMLQRLTHRSQLPIVLIAGIPLTLEDLRAEQVADTLKARVEKSGAVIDGANQRRRRR